MTTDGLVTIQVTPDVAAALEFDGWVHDEDGLRIARQDPPPGQGVLTFDLDNPRA